jgi:ABC-type nitrate/sulfonate/bicarbonate transport system substrate-binding protein
VPIRKLRVSRILFMVLLLIWRWPSEKEAGAAEGRGKPEKSQLEVAIAATGPLYLPILVAQEAGYFGKHGLTVSINQVSASTAVQGLISGKIDIYQGGATAITGNLAGSDIIYVAASVDRSTLVLFGQKGLNFFESLRGKAVATTSPGAFGEIALRRSAKEHHLEVGKDIKLLYHRGPPEAFGTFLAGNADALIVTPPQSDVARSKGYPVIIDYYERGLKIIGPGTAVTREFFQKHPNTLRVFLMAYLDGVKRCVDDRLFADKINSKHSRTSDPQVLEENYQTGLKVWNKNMRVDPEAIRIVLEGSANPQAKDADPRRFYDNSIIEAINREYASQLFPGEVK